MTTEPAVRRFAAAVSGSRLVQVCLRMAASMRARPDVLPHGVVTGDLSALRSLFAGSSLTAPMGGRARRAVEAVADSHALRMLAGWRTRFGSLERWQVVRAAGISGVTAVAVNAALSLVDPRPASNYRWLLWLAAVLVSAVLTIGARSFEAARGESRALRHL
jgi:hypothetical protein